jgi:antitoxin component YwqK of YwqJK toxin-antitoxin module
MHSKILMMAAALAVPMAANAVVGFHLNADGTPLIMGEQVIQCPNAAGEGRYSRSYSTSSERMIRGTCVNGLYQDSWKFWHENGELKWRAEFAAGQFTGRFKSWHDNEQVQAILDFNESGVIHGDYRSWYSDGLLRAEGQYRDGEEHGCWVTNHNNGQRASKGAYEAGAKVGKWFYWDQAGERRREDNGGEASDGCLIMF